MILSTSKQRVSVSWKTETHLLLVPETWDKLTDLLTSSFKLEEEFDILTTGGAVVTGIDLIRDGDELRLRSLTSSPFHDNSWITLNVGGHIVQTTWRTLTKEKETMLARMFDNDSNWKNKTDSNGAYLIDRSPKHFLPLLDYLRNGEIVLDKDINPQGVLLEAKFFGFTELTGKIEELMLASERKVLEPLCRDDVIRALITTPSNYILRFRGLDFSGADLSNMDLRHVNFSHSKLVGTNLTKSDVYGANFDKADMRGARLDEANAAGVSMEGAVLDDASMVRCNFEDSKLRPSSLLGAQMKSVNLENSNLAGVNMRVVNLRGSCLKNSSLKGACLAGADLEGCDLNGAELYNTNLRGANLTNVNFEDITTALHMTHMT